MQHKAAPSLNRSAIHNDRQRLGLFNLNVRNNIQLIQQIRKNDWDAKIILFSQWQVLQAKIESTLWLYGVNYCSLTGSASKKTTILESFSSTGSETPYVMVMSLEKAASGTNLTIANHVIIVHPMVADTLDRFQIVGKKDLKVHDTRNLSDRAPAGLLFPWNRRKPEKT